MGLVLARKKSDGSIVQQTDPVHSYLRTFESQKALMQHCNDKCKAAGELSDMFSTTTVIYGNHSIDIDINNVNSHQSSQCQHSALNRVERWIVSKVHHPIR
jgi:hypothetical protein